MPVQRLIKNIRFNPKQLFIIDGVGALFSAFMLGVVLVRFESVFGIPIHALYILSLIPIGFVMYDIIAYNLDDNYLYLSLKIIAVLNFLYCWFSIGLSFYHIASITIFGWCYIIIEVLIIGGIVTLEWKISNKQKIKRLL